MKAIWPINSYGTGNNQIKIFNKIWLGCWSRRPYKKEPRSQTFNHFAMGRGFFRTRLLLSLLVVGASLSITNAASEVSEQTPATGNATDQAEQPEDAATVKDKRSWEYNKEMRRMMGASWKKNYGRPVYIGSIKTNIFCLFFLNFSFFRLSAKYSDEE